MIRTFDLRPELCRSSAYRYRLHQVSFEAFKLIKSFENFSNVLKRLWTTSRKPHICTLHKRALDSPASMVDGVTPVNEPVVRQLSQGRTVQTNAHLLTLGHTRNLANIFRTEFEARTVKTQISS